MGEGRIGMSILSRNAGVERRTHLTGLLMAIVRTVTFILIEMESAETAPSF